jgi:hypothetical protein
MLGAPKARRRNDSHHSANGRKNPSTYLFQLVYPIGNLSGVIAAASSWIYPTASETLSPDAWDSLAKEILPYLFSDHRRE